MNLLALDTSSTACSVALLVRGKMTKRHVPLENRHSEYVLKFVESLINDAGFDLNGLDAIAIGNGPGSFTGLRLGMGVAQGLAFGLNKPLVTVSSMQAIAKTSGAKNIFVAVDARMGEVYWQCFHLRSEQHLQAVDCVRLNRPGDIELADPELNWQGVGSGFDQYTDVLSAKLTHRDNWIKGIYPQASSVMALAQAQILTHGMPGDSWAVPVYVRNKVTY